MQCWHFNQPPRGAINREPIVGEFFSTDIIRNPTEALVRESIQNSLDAACNGEMVRVRFFVSGATAALAPEKMSRYMTEGWPHFLAEHNGLREQPDQNQPCPFLIIEDFGTTGLTGDVQQGRFESGVRNPFYYFFRAEGQSGKSESDRGRWGVGKTVFPRSSRINTFFGMTVRQDDQLRLMMGRAVLRSHYVNGAYYAPDGFFGNCDEDGFPLPIDNKNLIQQFCHDFRLKRKNETGLSVVVPWCDEEVTFDGLLEAVIRQYYYPLLSGNLQVTVASPDREALLNNETLLTELQKLSSDSTDELRALIQLAQWANQQREESMFILAAPSVQDAFRWSSAWFGEQQITEMRATLERGETLAVRIPITVREKKRAGQQSFFDVFFVRDGNNEGSRPVFIREGIIISDIRPSKNRGYRSMVIVRDKPLATLLGDSENPAHTQWQKDSSNYKGKYIHGDRYIPFVTQSVTKIIQAITEEQNRIDPTLLLDIFSLPASQKEDSAKTRKKKLEQHKGSDPDKVDPPPTSFRRFIVQKVPGGFSVLKGSLNAPPPAQLSVRVAYDIRRGNPLKKYNPADFAVEKLNITLQGVELSRAEGNEIQITVIDPNFALTVTGFDENRDIYVKVNVVQEDNDDPEA